MALGTSLSIVVGYVNAYGPYIKLVGSHLYIDYNTY
jgi:hypothetical protein